MQAIHVDLVNASTAVSARDARRFLAALRVQLRRDFAPVWGTTADLHYVGPGDEPHPGAWQLVLLDQREPGTQGFHELTRDGLPLGKVFVREANEWPSGWTGTASHELLELLVDPDTTLGVFVEDESLGPRIYSYEVCDPVQDDRFSYEIEGVPVSDFVHPAWFEPWRKRGSARFDHAKKLRLPFQVPAGCYAMFYDVRKRRWLENWGGKVIPHLGVYGGLGPARASSPAPARALGSDAALDRGGSRRSLHGSPRSDGRRRDCWKKSKR